MEVLTPNELFNNAVLNAITYDDTVTYFGKNSAEGALLWATSNQANAIMASVAEIYRRSILKAASGDYLHDKAEENGVAWEGLATRASMYIVVVPEYAIVSNIAGGGPNYTLTIDNEAFLAADVVLVRGADGTVTESAVVGAVGAGTITLPLNAANVVAWNADIAAGGEVVVIFQATVPVDTTVTTSVGVTFETTKAVTTGNVNPILNGESSALALVDKAWCECTVTGSNGNVDQMSATGITPTVRGVARVFNPVQASGGTDDKSDYQIKYEVSHAATALAATPQLAIEAIAKQGNGDVFRLAYDTAGILNTISVRALTRSLSSLSSSAKTELAAYIQSRISYEVTVSISNVTMTAVEVSASVNLTPGYTLKQVWIDSVTSLATYLDLNRWPWGTDVDNSQLLRILLDTEGLASLDTATFTPAADVTVATNSLPYLARLTLTDANSGLSVGADIAQVY